MEINKVSERLIVLSPTVEAGLEREPKTDDFDIKARLGQGGFGKVYKCAHRDSQKLYAVKQISKKVIRQNKMQQQLIKEIKIMYQLEHQNIIKLYNHFEEEDFIFLVIEYAAKGQLWNKLQQQGKLQVQEVKYYLKDIIEALECLHSHNIIHRDIKPENLLITQNNRIKLADFGWSTQISQNMRQTFCGTLEYLAPEMILQQGHDKKIDIWSIGVLVYELLTGQAPFFNQEKYAQVANKMSKQKFLEQNIVKGNIDFPNDFDEVAKDLIEKLLQKEPDERLDLQGIKGHYFLKNVSYVKEEIKAGISFNEADMKSVVNKKGYSKELILRCANTGGVLKPYKQIEKKGNNNDELVHELQKKNLVLQQQIYEHEITIEKQKIEMENMKYQLEKQNENGMKMALQRTNTSDLQGYQQDLEQKNQVIQNSQEQLKCQIQKYEQIKQQYHEQFDKNKELCGQLEEMQEENKELKQKNTELIMKGMESSDRMSDVNNLIKVDIRDLLKELNQQIQFYKEKSEEYEDMSAKIQEQEVMISNMKTQQKYLMQEQILEQKEQLEREFEDKLEQLKFTSQNEQNKLKKENETLSRQLNKLQSSNKGSTALEMNIQSLKKEIKTMKEQIETRQADWELSKVYVKKVEEENKEYKRQNKTLQQTIKYLQPQQ